MPRPAPRPAPKPIPLPAGHAKSGDAARRREETAADSIPTWKTLLAEAVRRREFAVTLVSAAVHMILVISLALWHLTPPSKKGIHLMASVDIPPAALAVQPTLQVDGPVLAAGPRILGTVTAVAPIRAPAAIGNNIDMPRTVASLDGAAFGEAAVRGGAGGEDAVSFFGSTSLARRVVFIVDASSSMEGERFTRAKEELLAAVSNLKADQRFYVFFFSDKSYPMLAPRSPPDMLPLNGKNWELLIRWVSGQELVGDTKPRTSLARAFQMKPDVIYLLTDGDFNDETYPYLMQMSRSRVRINTIGFQTEEPTRNALEDIAKKFGGEFTEVQ